jgi:hypothetical protein
LIVEVIIITNPLSVGYSYAVNAGLDHVVRLGSRLETAAAGISSLAI